MRRLAAASIVGVLVLGSAGVAEAQGVLPFAIEARGGFAVPTGDWNEEDAIENGLGFGANVQLQVAPLISVYAGWERYTFGIETDEDGEVEGVDADVTDSGFRLGGQVNLPLAAITGVSPFVFGGLIYNQVEIEIEDDGASVSVESDGSLGFEAGAGVAIPIAPALSLTPALRYRSHSAEFDAFDALGGEETTVSYLSLDIGLKFGI